MTTDPYAHLPRLRDRLIPPETSAVRVTPEVLALWDQRAMALGRAANWRLPDEEREASRRALLGGCADRQDLWVYAYGSLMWDPGIHFAEVRLADLDGYRRRFTYRITAGRGSPECPALMLALDRHPGSCRGLAFRIDAGMAECESEILWRREMIRGGYAPTLLPMTTPQGPIEALVFAANPLHQEYVGELPLDETAALIACGAGPLGTNRHYLEQLAEQLANLEIVDNYVTGLLGRVQALGGA